jgi:hypothetical protein
MKKRPIVIRQLLWNDANSAHIARHKIVPAEVEEVCRGDRIERAGHVGRIFLVGKTQAGRMLSVVLDPTPIPEVYKPVTAYDSSKASVQDYLNETQGGEEEAA